MNNRIDGSHIFHFNYHQLKLCIKVWLEVAPKGSSLVISHLEETKPGLTGEKVDECIRVLAGLARQLCSS